MTENERKAASEKYYQELRGKLDERIRKDDRLNKISQKIRENAADFNDTAQYSELVSNHIADVLQENVGDITSPLAKEYVCKELLKDQHSAINEVLGAVQVSIDEKNGIHIAPQKASFPLERVMKVAHALEDPTVPPETIKRRAGAPVANISKSFHDDYMKENAKFRNDAGLKCYITRMGTSCCPWCSEVAGRFRFGDQPDDIFRRHDNCDCTIIYDNQVLRGQRSADGGRTKTWEQIGDVPTDYQPTVFTQEQAKAIEQRNLSQFKGLTNGENSGKIKVDERFDLHPDKINKFLLLPGAKHSEEFFHVGYKPDDYERLFDDISSGFDMKKAVDFRINPNGKEGFSIFMELGVTKKRSFRTTWERDDSDSKPRFTSAYRNKAKKR